MLNFIGFSTMNSHQPITHNREESLTDLDDIIAEEEAENGVFIRFLSPTSTLPTAIFCRRSPNTEDHLCSSEAVARDHRAELHLAGFRGNWGRRDVWKLLETSAMEGAATAESAPISLPASETAYAEEARESAFYSLALLAGNENK